MNRILLAEDDSNLGLLLKEYLEAKDYVVELFPDGEAALEGYHQQTFDLCILDVMMPRKDGFCRRQGNSRAQSGNTSVVFNRPLYEGRCARRFRIGADDYLTKPFSMEELLFRIEAILRRTRQGGAEQWLTYRLGKYTFESQKQELYAGRSTTSSLPRSLNCSGCFVTTPTRCWSGTSP
jgi:DNA-binding response OmpR family regulator